MATATPVPGNWIWTQVTGGRQALVGLPRTTCLWTAFIAAAISLIVAALYERTRHGLALVG